MVPENVESERMNRLFVGQILHLLEKNDAEHSVELFGFPSFEFG